MQRLIAAVVLPCAAIVAVNLVWFPYTSIGQNDGPQYELSDISASRHPVSAAPIYTEPSPVSAPVTPPTRAVGSKPKPLPQMLLAEASKSLGKGPRELGVRRSLWCADFFNKTLARLGLKGTGSALASSFVHWGKASKPGPGVIAVKTRTGGNHVVVIKSIKGNTVIAISPNSRGKVREMRYSVRQFYAFRVPA